MTKGLATLAKWLAYCAGGSLLVMMALVNINVFLRPLGLPIWGTYELVGFLGSMTLSLALFKITLDKGHMAVEILISRLPRRLNRALGLFNGLVGTIMFSLVAWRCTALGYEIWRTGEVSPTLSMPFHPFVFGVALAFAGAAVAMFLNLLKSLGSEKK